MTDSRSIDLSVEVPGTLEEVWDTIATGPGVGSWFVPMEVDERIGGEVAMDFGPSFGKETATVTAWEPPNRFSYQSGGDRPLAYEWLVEARDGGTCVVRLVNSGFGAGEEWDGDFEGMSNGWRLFLDNLRVQLTHFRNRRAVAIIPTVMVKGPNAAVWSALCAALGVPEGLSEGERLRASGADVPVLSGTVHAVVRTPEVNEYHLLLDEPAEGAAFIATEGGGEQVACSVYLYLYGTVDDGVRDAWFSWLPATLGEPAAVE
jgi:uncharacterized protein YndB with AHSA1/START domain